MATPEERLTEARRRLAEQYRRVGEPILAAGIVKGSHLNPAVEVFALTLAELKWEPPVDPETEAILKAWELWWKMDLEADERGIPLDLIAIWQAARAFERRFWKAEA